MSGAAPRPRKLSLPNGATMLLEESHDLPLVDLTIAFRTGSALDPASKAGRTRLFTRMLRRGSEGWTSDRVEEAIDTLGAELAVDVGSSTITLHAQVIRRNLAPFAELLATILQKPTFPQDELDRLQRETLAELIEARDSDRALASRAFRKAVFGDHPYGRSSQGTAATVPTITRADVVEAHRLHFTRGNAIFGVSGDVTEDDARTILGPVLEAIRAGDAVVDPTKDPAPISGRRLVFVDKPARTQTQILIGGLGTHGSDPDHVPLHVANTIFGGTFTARMMKSIRSERGWSYGASSRAPIDRRRESFAMWTFPAATDAAPCVALELEMLEAFVNDGITDQELAFVQSYLSESHAFDIDTPFKRLRQVIDEELLALPEGYHTRYVEQVRAVTRQQANDALKKRLSSEDLVVAVVGTASELLEKIEAAIPRLQSTEVVPFDRD